MSTNALLGLKQLDGKIFSIDVQHYHYESLRYWDTADKVSKLIGEGNMSWLGSELGEVHTPSADSPREWCEFYRRDWGRKGDLYKLHHTFKSFYGRGLDYNYCWLFSEKLGCWLTVLKDGTLCGTLTISSGDSNAY